MSRAYQLALLLVIMLAAEACRSRDDTFARRTQDFEIVEEGAVAGVTSTISPPGEGPAPLLPPPPPFTDTNADTTTSFTMIDPTTTTGTELPPTLADTLPPDRPVTRPRPAPPAQAAPSEPAPPTQTAPPDPAPAPSPESPPPPSPAQEEESGEEPAEDPPPPPTRLENPKIPRFARLGMTV